jgi:hypothetical protein
LSGSVAGITIPTLVVLGEFSKMSRARSIASGASDGCSLTSMTVIKTGASANNPVGVPPSKIGRASCRERVY